MESFAETQPLLFGLMIVLIYVTGFVIALGIFKRMGTDYDKEEGDIALLITCMWPVALIIFCVVAPFVLLYRLVAGSD